MAQRNPRAREPEPKSNREIPIFIAGAVCLLVELCFFHVLGTVGNWISYAFFGVFGLGSYVLPVLIFLAMLYMTYSGKRGVSKIVYGIIFFLCLDAFLHMVSLEGYETFTLGETFKACAEKLTGGGFIGGTFALGLTKAISQVGAYIVTILAALICLVAICELPLIEWIKTLISALKMDDYDEYDDYDEEDEEPDKIVEVRRRPSENDGRRVQRRREPLPEWDEDYGYEEPRMRPREEEDVVYETRSDEGVVIRFVNAQKGRRRPRAPLVRTQNKARPLRAGTPANVRPLPKRKGISDQLDLDPSRGNIDEMREITAKPETLAPPEEAEEAVLPNAVAAPPEPEEAVLQPKENPVRRRERKPASKVTTETLITPQAPKPKTQKNSLPADAEVKKTPVKASKKKGSYAYPPLSLLAQRKGKSKGVNNAELDQVAHNLEVILDNFGVGAKVIDRQVGPSVTRFELQPEMGTRVNKFTSLVDDLKLNLAVSDIRIEAPIPGRAAIGIEIPNEQKETVLIREILEAPELINHKSKIAFAAGINISGDVVVADIAKMPHLLVAGTTGSGKSVFMNSIIMAILFRAKPSEVGLIIIDPKKIEFGVYSGIPHLIKDVVTDPGQAVSTLRWAVNEMTNRYQRMQLSGVRDFKSYNEKFDKGTLNSEEENPKRMPQIVIVIDELADLMMVASKEAEALICRLAQLARAAGIHLIIATQRPSVDVVTGLIKANIPGRVALLVASQVDSRTIIDMKGAEELLGYGDMLFYPTGYTKPVRVQGAFVSDEEVANVVDFLKKNKTEDYFSEEAAQIEEYMNNAGETQSMEGGGDSSGGSGQDEFLYEAGKLCIEMGKASSSMLQRHFSVGFNRAARIIDQLTEMGAVGPANGAKPREILVDLMTFEEMFRSKGE